MVSRGNACAPEVTVHVCGCGYVCSYGEAAWWWETEELVRKLLLTAVAVLLDAGSPLQVRPRCLLTCRLGVRRT